MISGKEHFWHAFSFEYLWTGILGVLFLPIELLTEWVTFPWLMREYSWDKPYHAIDEHEAREFTTWEYIFANRDLLYIEEFKYTLIDTFIMSADDDASSWWLIVLCILLKPCLRQYCTTWSHEIKGKWSIELVEIPYRISERFNGDDGTSSSTIGPIIHPTGIADCPVGEVVEYIAKEPLFLGSFHHTCIEVCSHALSEEREYMDIQLFQKIIELLRLQHQRFLRQSRESSQREGESHR